MGDVFLDKAMVGVVASNSRGDPVEDPDASIRGAVPALRQEDVAGGVLGEPTHGALSLFVWPDMDRAISWKEIIMKLHEIDPVVLAKQYVENHHSAFQALNEELERFGVAPGSAGHTAASISFGMIMGMHQIHWWEEEEVKNRRKP